MKLGDIFELKTEGKKAYIQYVKKAKDKTQLEGIRVFYDLYNEEPDFLNLITNDSFFYLKLPLRSAIRKKLVRFIKNETLSENFTFPRYFRTENIFGKGWSIMDSEGGQKNVMKLTKEYLKLSPYGMWNIPLIIENLENGWRLEHWK